MKTKLYKLLIGLVLAASLHQAVAQGTAFSNEGKLNVGMNPVTGSFDLTFALFDAPTNGIQQGLTITNLATGVTNGLFTSVLDFGNQFSGASRWLQIAVRTNGITGYTNLSPRVALLPTPYAVYAEAAGVSSSVSNAVITAAALNTVGAPSSGQVLSYTGSALSWITPTPNGGLTLPYSGGVSSSSSPFTLTNSGTGPVLDASDGSEDTLLDGNSITFTRTTGPGYIQAKNRIDFETGVGGIGGDAGANLILYPGQISSFNGNVGIGTTAPAAQLDAENSSTNAVAIRGSNSLGGAYGELAVSETYAGNVINIAKGTISPKDVTYYYNYFGVYGNGGIPSTLNNTYGNYAGYFDGNIYANGQVSINGPISVNGQVSTSSIRSPGAGINSSTFAFTQQAVGTNTQGNGTKIFNSLCDGDPNAILIITHNWGADTNSTSQFNTKPVGVYYNSGLGHWVILNEDNSAMALGRAFNVMVIKP